MRSVFAVCTLLLLAVCPALAQEKPEITIGSSAQPRILNETCVEVEIGGEKAPSLGCLNQKLKHEVDRVAPSVNSPPLDARSPDTRVGVANTVAVQQQYGPNFGRSAVPFRPTQAFTLPPALRH